MDKETILQKARQGEDEMEVQVRDKSIKYTYITLVVTAAIFAYLRGLRGQPVMDLCATVCYSVFAGQLYRWRMTRKRENLILAVVTLITAVTATVRYFLGH